MQLDYMEILGQLNRKSKFSSVYGRFCGDRKDFELRLPVVWFDFKLVSYNPTFGSGAGEYIIEPHEGDRKYSLYVPDLPDIYRMGVMVPRKDGGNVRWGALRSDYTPCGEEYDDIHPDELFGFF